MITLAMTGKADKRILAYPLIHACSIAGKVCVITDDVAFKRLYEGTDNKGTIAQTDIYIFPTFDEDSMIYVKRLAQEGDVDYLICIFDSFCPKDANHTLMLCEYNQSFLGESIESIDYARDDVTFGMITLTPRRNLEKVAKNIKVMQLGWRPEYSVYLMRTEEYRKLLPISDKAIVTFLVNTYASTLELKPSTLSHLIKRQKYVIKRK